VLALALFLISTKTLRTSIPLRWNVSLSQRPGFYLQRDVVKRLQRGDLVAVCLPEDLAIPFKLRGYLGTGTCEGRVAPVGKHIVAVEGDRVAITSDGVFVNDQLIRHSRQRSTDSRGRDLESQEHGERLLEAGEIWLHAANPRSLDSRVYGPLSEERVIGHLTPWWTF